MKTSVSYRSTKQIIQSVSIQNPEIFVLFYKDPHGSVFPPPKAAVQSVNSAQVWFQLDFERFIDFKYYCFQDSYLVTTILEILIKA
jgi:hypothetical protein